MNATFSLAEFWNLVAPGLFGLAGVLIGGVITYRGQRAERRALYLRRQLDEFYSPLLGLRARILASSEVRVKVSGAADSAWRKLVERIPRDRQRDELEKRIPDWHRIIDEDNRHLAEVIIPLYRQMMEHFSMQMGLAEPSTRVYFGALVEFVELWERHLARTLPVEVSREIRTSEEPLMPFYEDLAANLDTLRVRLKQGR